MIRITEIMDKVSSYIEDADLDLIRRAYIFSATAHEGQVRLSGEPYLSHPMAVAGILADMRLDEASVAAGLLHDTVEDTKATIDEIEDLFGSDVADIVDGVTKISQMQMTFDSQEAAKAENIRKMILAMAEDIRVLMVKLADRLHNIRTLSFQKPMKQRLIARETLDIYSPLANRLGLHQIKTELEDLSFSFLKPDIFAQINDGIAGHHSAERDYIDKVQNLLTEMLAENKIKGRVLGRTKHIYSIYNKMVQQNLSLDQIYDLIAFRVIVGGVRDCYSVLGLVHAAWKPVPGRFKDYISIPKNNMYQSLHTTVFGPEGERIEIQIRTKEMNRVAEYGVAAHWQYKEGSKGAKIKDAERFTWLRQILDWQRELKDPKEFMSSLRFDLFHDEVYVFTPGGDVKELPDGATPVDFAYLIHTDVGKHCAGAKVNGKLVPLHTKLVNGDSVEIITDKKRTPSRDWLKFVKTAKARTRIKHWIRTEERARAITFGRELLEKEGRRVGVNVAKAMKDGQFLPLTDHFSCGSVDDLVANVGYSRLTARKVLHKLLAEMRGEEGELPEAPREKPEDKAKPPRSSEKVQIKGVDDVLVRFAGCCNPLPGESIVGYISRGRGVTVHTADCPNVAGFEPERLLSISWAGQEDTTYMARIRVRCRNVKGALASISKVLADADVNIDSGTFKSNVDGKTEMEFAVEVRGFDHLQRALANVNRLKPVIETARIESGEKVKKH